MTVVFLVWPAEQFAAQTITTAYGIPPGDLSQIAVTNPHLSDHGRARARHVRSCCEWRQVPDLPMSRIAEMMGRIYAADDIQALEFCGSQSKLQRQESEKWTFV
jgi:hypothetical protein